MVRAPSFVKNMKKGTWTSEEDQKLVTYIEQHGHGTWREVPVKAGLRRCGKSCRLRWTNYLRPDIKRGRFSLQEEQTIIHLHALLGNRWSAIATHLPKRTDNQIKNYWNGHLKKRIIKMGIDPITHKSITLNTNLSHVTQWEIARLEAEARLVRESRFVPNFYQRINHGPAPLGNKSLMTSFSLPLPLDVLKASQNIIMCKLSNFSGLKTPISQNMPIMIFENAGPQVHEDTTVEDHTKNWNVSKGSFNTLESPEKEGTHNILEVSDMMFQDNHLTDAFTNQLFNDANNDNYHDDFEHDTNYWSSILNESAF